MTTPTAGEVLTVSDEEIADLLKQITDLGRLLDISQECVRDLRARLAAAESRLREYEDAPVVAYEIVFKTGRWLKYDPEGYSPDTTNELITRPKRKEN